MNDFLEFFDGKVQLSPMHLDIYYGKICGWYIHIYKKGCAADGGDLAIVKEQDSDMKLCFAKAHVALKEWLSEKRRWILKGDSIWAY